MYLVTLKDKKLGKTHLFIQHQFRDPGTKKKKTKTVKNLGFVEDYLDKYDDPIQHFKDELAKERDEKKLAQIKNSVITVSIQSDGIMEFTGINKTYDITKDIGNYPIQWVLNQLEVFSFLNKKQKEFKIEYKLEDLLKLLVYKRILAPASKLNDWKNKDSYFENFKMSLDSTYRALDKFNLLKDELLMHIHTIMMEKFQRDSSLMFYDVTNVHFEIENEDSFRRRGVAKNHQPLPLASIGLFMDKNGLPVWFEVYPGNTNDCKTFLPAFEKMQRLAGLKHSIYIADKGMYAGDNIGNLIANKCGYVIAESVRKASAKMQSIVIDATGYVCNDISGKEKPIPLTDDGAIDYDKINFMYKVVDMPDKIAITGKDGKKHTISNFQKKKIIFWSKKYARRSKFDRLAAVEKAQAAVGSKSKSVIDNNYGKNRLLKTVITDANKNEIDGWNAELAFDFNKLNEEEKLDGFYIIETNVTGLADGEAPREGVESFWDKKNMQLKLNHKVTHQEIIDMYRGLWQIEECFRITKSEFDLRPVFVNKKEHITAHVLICFMSLFVIKFLKIETGEKYTTNEIIDSLRSAKVAKLDRRHYINLFYNEVLQDLRDLTGFQYSQKAFSEDYFIKMRKI